jgi:PAS domain S-box-containing protein
MADTPSQSLSPPPSEPHRASAGESPLQYAAQLLDLLPDAILCLDANWRITFANAEARRISRLESSDLNHKTHWELYPEAVGTPIEKLYREVMETRTPGHIEYFYEHFNCWLDITAVPLDGGIALHYRDISDLKQVEAQENIAARRRQQVFDAAPDSIICIDRNWNCTYFNRAASTILKTSELLGENLWERFPINQQEPFASNYRLTMEQGIPTDFEAWYPEPLNVWFKVWARPYEDGIIIFSNNISDRKRAEAVRDASTRQLQQVFEATSNGIVSLARDWTITFLNQQAADVFGRTDLIGRNMWEEFPAALDSDFHEYYSRTMIERTPTEFEAFYPAPLDIWVSVQCRPSDDGIVVFFTDITERRASEQFLGEQQSLLASIQGLSRLATWDIDVSSGRILFGQGSFDVYGHPLSTVSTMTAFEQILLPAHQSRVENIFQKAIASGQTETVEFQVITQDGELVWLESRLQAIVENSMPIRLRGMTFDIDARKRQEEDLRASEARYRVLADLNPQALWIGTPDGRIVYANQGFLDYTGKTIEALGGLDWLSGFDPADHDRILAAWTHSVATGDEYLVDARIIQASDGASRWWTLRALPVRDESGAIQQWLGVANDIHESRTAAEALRKEQEETERQRAELETIYETAPVGLALFDPVEFRYLRVNDRQAETIGLPKDQIIGRPIAEVAPLKGLKDLFESAAAGQPIRNHLLEGELPNRPGDHRFWNVSYSPIYNSNGIISAIAAVILEITHQKKSELALIQSEKLAAVGRLASSISHEINNPLEAITNLLFLIGLDEELPESIKGYVHMAQSELGRVSQIVTQTLRFHRQAVKPTSVTGAELVNAVLNLYQGRLTNSGIQVETKYTTQTRILCFENDIRQVLNNLISNAIDAMRGGGHLLARAHDATHIDPETGVSRKGIRITIADTGHGMSAQTRDRIFEPFYTTKDLNGTGLGLWISSGIIAHHHGHLTLRSTQSPEYHGTIFSLFLPCETL